MWFSTFLRGCCKIIKMMSLQHPCSIFYIKIILPSVLYTHRYSCKILHSLNKKLHSAFSINAYNRVCLEKDRRYGYDEKNDRRQPGKIDCNVYDTFADRKYLSAII